MRPPPWGLMSQLEPQTILKTDERSIHLEPEREGKFAAKLSGWDENRVFLEATSSRGQSRTGAGADPHPGAAALALRDADPVPSSTSSSRTEPDVCTRTGDREDCRAFSKAEIRWSIS